MAPVPIEERTSLAFIFPAFVNEYPENPFEGLPGLKEYFDSFLTKATGSIMPELQNFSFSEGRNFCDHELATQVITFTFGCAISEFLKEKEIKPEFLAGYSMGIYAALFHAGVISFTDGLSLVQKAHESILKITGDKQFGMATVIGLSHEDISGLISGMQGKIEITNRNSEFAFVISGEGIAIDSFLLKAMEEGALHTRKLNTHIPYHSSFLKDAAGLFGNFVETVSFKSPDTKIISLVDQRVLNNPYLLKKEVIRNLYTHLDWYQTHIRLLDFGINFLVECGPDSSLVKNSKFIPGYFKFLPALAYLKNQT